MPINIAMDGPVGAGKSAVAGRVAQELGILHLDPGAMYRALALHVLRAGVDPAQEEAACAACADARVEVRYEDGAQRTLLGGEDVSGLIRTPEVSMAPSTLSQWPQVRERMVALQRAIAAEHDVLLDGRDIGTRVLPNATAKFYLTASPEERARRRCAQYRQAGREADFEAVLREVNARDEQDMHRALDPLRRAEDAVEIDSTDLTLEQVVNLIAGLSRAEAMKARGART